MKERKLTLIIKYGILIFLLFFSFVPVLMMISMSLRDTVSIYGDFWGLPWPPRFSNYSSAILDLLAPAARTIYVIIISNLGILFFSSIAAYAFARIRFFGKEVLFGFIISLIMIPGVLLLTPNFILADKLNLRNTFTGLIVFYIAGGLVFAIFLLRTFFQSQPEELFESARLDGATELKCIMTIAVPISRPILITLFIMNFLGIYNDLMWPMLMISDSGKQLLMVALQNYNPNVDMIFSRPEIGIQTAGYTFATILLLIVFVLGMRYYIQGITSGAVKA